jgi:ssDNA-binding replication factor A large subunit
MMNLSYDEIIGRICSEKRVGKDEVEIKIKEKITKFADLITKEGAAHIVANEMGVKLVKDFEKKDIKISKLIPGYNHVDVKGKVVTLYGVREFNKNGREGKVANFLMGDETGVVRAVLWDTNHIKEIEDEKLKENSVLILKNCYVKENNGFTEVHLGNQGEIEFIDEEITVNTVVKSNTVRKKINELKENDTAEILGHVVQIFEPRSYTACSECNKKVIDQCADHGEAEVKEVPIVNIYLDDGTENIRLVAFRENAEKILENTTNFEEALGKFLVVQGRVVKNEMFERTEMIANSVSEGDYKDMN